MAEMNDKEMKEKYEYVGGAKAIRPQTPCDARMPAEPWKPGTAPIGGFRSTFSFGASGKTTTGVSPFKAPGLTDKKDRKY